MAIKLSEEKHDNAKKECREKQMSKQVEILGSVTLKEGKKIVHI